MYVCIIFIRAILLCTVEPQHLANQLWTHTLINASISQQCFICMYGVILGVLVFIYTFCICMGGMERGHPMGQKECPY